MTMLEYFLCRACSKPRHQVIVDARHWRRHLRSKRHQAAENARRKEVTP